MSKKFFVNVLIFIAALTMVTLGFWQLSRHSDKKEINNTINDRILENPVNLADLRIDQQTESSLTDIEYRSVQATGLFKHSDSILVRNRPLNGSPGYWLLTPFDLGNGRVVIVNRGWLPIAAEDFRQTNSDQITIEGIIRKTQLASGLQREDSKEGKLASLGRVDLSRYQQQLEYEILPVFIQVINQDPPQSSNFPKMLSIPEFKEGQHLNYAVQWFIFATITIIGYPLVFFRNRRKKDKGFGQSDIPIDYL